jgi:hypothetical protein
MGIYVLYSMLFVSQYLSTYQYCPLQIILAFQFQMYSNTCSSTVYSYQCMNAITTTYYAALQFERYQTKQEITRRADLNLILVQCTVCVRTSIPGTCSATYNSYYVFLTSH